MRFLLLTFITLVTLSYTQLCLAFHPCPEGTSPDKLQTYPPAIILMLLGIFMIYIFEKKIEKKILKRIFQALTAVISIIAAFVVFGVLSAMVPCK